MWAGITQRRLSVKVVKIKQTKKEFDLTNVSKVHTMVNRVAEMIVIDIKEGITRLSQDIHGKAFKSISPATAKKKGHSAPLIDSGKMKEVYVKEKATKGNFRAEIGMNQRDTKTKKHKTYGHIHNQGIKPQVKREWFGVGERAIKRVDKAVEEWIRLIYRFKG